MFFFFKACPVNIFIIPLQLRTYPLTKRCHVSVQVHSAVKVPRSTQVDRHVGGSTLPWSRLNSDWTNFKSTTDFFHPINTGQR